MLFIENNQQNLDINESKKFLKSARIVSEKQFDTFLKARISKEARKEKVKELIFKNSFAFKTQTGGYVLSSPIINYSLFNKKHSMIISTFLKLYPELNYLNMNCKIPCCAYICDENYPRKYVNLYYFSTGDEPLDTVLLETNFALEDTKKSPINTIILIDNVEQIEKISLSKSFNVLAFAIQNDDETVTFLDKELNKIERIFINE